MGVSAKMTVADLGAATAYTDGSTVFVTPGNTITVALNSSTSVASWQLRVQSDNKALDGLAWLQSATFSQAIALPAAPCTFTLVSEASDGTSVNIQSLVVKSLQAQTAQPVIYARNAVIANVANLSAYTVTSNASLNDATLNVQGDVVLLAAQSTAAQNGAYVVGAVAAGSAALTRHPAMPSGQTLPSAFQVNVSEGTVFKNTQWIATASGAPVVGTSDGAFYPKVYATTKAAAAATTANATGLFISASGVAVVTTQTTASTAMKAAATAGAGTGSVLITSSASSSDTFTICIINM